MALRRVACAVLLLLGAPAGPGLAAMPVEQIDREPGSDAQAAILLNTLRPALGGKGGRIDYVGSCPPANGVPQYVPLPRVDVRRPPKGMTGVDAVRAIFRADRRVAVSDGWRGVVDIRIGNAPQAVLRTPIARLNLTSVPRYNALLALFAVEDDADVAAALRKLGLRQALHVLNYLVAPPIPANPHLPATLRNVTVAQVFDLVARTFDGVVLYGVCAQSPVIDVDFIWLGENSGSNATFEPRRRSGDFALPPAAPASH